jgi:hypothetical protein
MTGAEGELKAASLVARTSRFQNGSRLGLPPSLTEMRLARFV